MKNTKKEVLRNCIPAMVCMVISGLNTIIDGLFIGRNIGEDGLAAINIAWPVPAFIIASGIGIGVGCGINYVSALGKKHEKEAKEFLKNAFVFLACAGILYSVIFEMTAPYLMKMLGAEGKVHTLAVQYTRIIAAAALLQIFGAGLVPIVRNLNMPIQAMAATISGVCSNFVFNTIFIFVLQMGMRGAALGTVLSQVVTSVIAGVSIKKSGALSREDVDEKAGNTGSLSCYKKAENKILSDEYIEKNSEKLYSENTNDIIKERYEEEKSSVYIKKIFFGGIASFGISLLPTWVLALTNYQCLSYGGSRTVACYAVISYLVYPAQNMLTGIADGVQPLFSMCAAKENMEKKEKQIKGVVTRLVVFVSILVMLLLFAVAPVFHKVFSLSSENYEPFVQGLRITAISLLFYGLNRLSITIMNGKGQHQEASIIIYGEAIIYTPFFLFVLPKLFLVTGIWIEPVAAAVLTEAVCVIGQLRKSEKYEYTKAG